MGHPEVAKVKKRQRKQTFWLLNAQPKEPESLKGRDG